MNFLRRFRPGAPADQKDDAVIIGRIIAEQVPRHWRAYAWAYVLMAVTAACTAASAALVGRIVNTIYVSADLKATVAGGLLIAGLFVVRGLASYHQSVTLASVSSGVTAEYQGLMFDKSLDENLAFFSGRHSSEVSAFINFAGGSVAAILNTLLMSSGRDLLTLAGLMSVMIYQDALMSLVSLLVLPAAAVSIRKLRQQVRRIAEAQYARGAAMFVVTQEAVQGLRVVKAFGLEALFRGRFRDAVSIAREAAVSMARISNRSTPLLETLGGIAVGLFFIYGGFRVITTGAAPGALFAFVTAFLLAYEPVKRLARVRVDIEASLVGARMLFETLDRPASEPNDTHLPNLRVSEGRLELRDIAFAYRPAEPVLRGLSLEASPRSVTALVGISGGGKSTIFNLILRLYEPSGGTILIDGQDLSLVNRASVRRQIAYVGQDTFLFRGSIRDNIAFGKPDAAPDEIVSAAKLAFAHDFIVEFPQGYETPVGEHGLQLSTGQRQRIAIARALIKDAPMILLDEPTASLDSESERQVRDAIARLCRNRTTLVIAHRLHTIIDARCICLIENGVVAETGKFEDLRRADGRFASLCRLQFHDEAA
jgi:ATP-binding cassette subfamily B protein